ncbi:MAG: protein jag, partial [Actinomycetota bacterium]
PAEGAAAPSPDGGQASQADTARETPGAGGATEGAGAPESGEAGHADEEYDEELEDARDEVLDFLDGLLEAMGVDGEADADVVDGAIDAWIEGDDLGLLIGRRGQVLDALQELLRIAVQRRLMERVRISLDVAGYRQRRRLAVEQRAEEMARLALEEGEVKLEAMSAFERKIVHETVARIEGVRSFSEGEEPRRCVVIVSGESPRVPSV